MSCLSFVCLLRVELPIDAEHTPSSGGPNYRGVGRRSLRRTWHYRRTVPGTNTWFRFFILTLLFTVFNISFSTK
jgi:hypothetical protein